MEFSSSERLQRHVDKAHAKMSKTHLKKETWGQSKTKKKKEERNVGSSQIKVVLPEKITTLTILQCKI